MSVDCPAYVELVHEFYSTFTFKKSDTFDTNTPNLIKFQLGAQHFSLSISEFTCAFGFEDDNVNDGDPPPLCDYPDDFVALDAFKELTGDPTVVFDPIGLKPISLRIFPCVMHTDSLHILFLVERIVRVFCLKLSYSFYGVWYIIKKLT